MENGRRQVNRNNPELSYAYGAQSDKRKRRSIFDHDASRTSINSNGNEQEDSNQARESVGRSEPSATPEPDTRYANLKRRKLEAQKRQEEEQQQQQQATRIQIRSPRRSTQASVRHADGVNDTPSRSKRNATSSGKSPTRNTRKKNIGDQEDVIASPPISTHGANSESQSSNARRSQSGLHDASHSRSIMHGKINSFYMDRDSESIEEAAEEDEVNKDVPSSLLLGAQRQSRDMFVSQTELDNVHASGVYDSRKLDFAQLQREADALAGPEESSISGSIVGTNKKNGTPSKGKGKRNARFASIDEEALSGGEQSGPENSKHSHTVVNGKRGVEQEVSRPLKGFTKVTPLDKPVAVNSSTSKSLLLCAALLGALLAALLTTQKDFSSSISPFPSNHTLGDKLLRHRIEVLERRLSKSEKQAVTLDQQILNVKSEADGLLDSTKAIPEVIRLLRDKESGRLKLDDKIIGELKKHFVEQGKGSDKPGQPQSISWDKFLKANEKVLHQYTKNAIADEIKTGDTIITRSQFVDLLKVELGKAKMDMEARFNENAQEMQNEILSKVREQREMFERSGSWKKVPDYNKGSSLPANMESIRASTMEIIEQALETYSADRIGERDYALYSAGGRVIPSFTSPTYGLRKRSSSLLGWLSNAPLMERVGAEGQPPVIALVPDVTPGMCWAFSGSEGNLGISLARRVIVSKITLEHTSPAISHDQRSAPRDVTVWGIVERSEDLKQLIEYRRQKIDVDEEKEDGPSPIPPSNRHLLLSSFTYDVTAPKMIQTFPISKEAEQLSIPIATVQVQVTSNHGKQEYTCLYRVRVHGREWTMEEDQKSHDKSVQSDNV